MAGNTVRILEALAILEAATLECMNRNVNTPEVKNTLGLLEPHTQPKWLSMQFRHYALKDRPGGGAPG